MFDRFARATSVLFLFLVSLQSVAGNLSFAVIEGTSSATDSIFMKAKYAPLAEHLAAATGDRVVLETPKTLSVVARNLDKKRYDVVLIRPSHLSARAMRDQGYGLLAVANGDAKVHFIVRGNSKLKALGDIDGHSIVMPDPLAYPSHLALALLRDKGIDPRRLNIQHLDRQDAVTLVVQSGLADIGVVMSYSKAGDEWQKNGGRFLFTQSKLPYWSMIVSPDVPPKTVDHLRRALFDLNQPAKAEKILANLGISGFNEGRKQAYLDMLSWVEGKRSAQVASNP
jgi:ABC-type phosphate/phosphonate transport system substrate-binding protein